MKADFGYILECGIAGLGTQKLATLLGMAQWVFKVVVLIHSSIRYVRVPPCSTSSTLANVKLENCCQADGCEMAFQCFNLQFPVYKGERQEHTLFVYWPFAFLLFFKLATGLFDSASIIGHALCVGVLYIFSILILCQSMVSFSPLNCNFKLI